LGGSICSALFLCLRGEGRVRDFTAFLADESFALPDALRDALLDRDAAGFLAARFAFAGLLFLWRKMPISLSEAGNGILPHEGLTTD